MRKKSTHWTHGPEKGHSLFMVAAALFVLLGISALAIDLAKMYVVRNEAQRAADAAALAGAKKFIDSGFLSGFISQATAEALAREEAIAVGAQNLVSGDGASILDADVTFDFSNVQNPQITVFVQRLISRGNGVETFFAKAVGIAEVDVGAVATAEAYTPSGGGGAVIGTKCLKPWILPNCDPEHVSPENPNCPGSAYFVDELNGTIFNPGLYGSGGVIGEPMVLKPGTPSEAAVPSQFYPIQIPPGTEPALCPDCSGPETGSDGPGAALYRHNIECCNTNTVACGTQVPLDLSTGNMVGPTRMGTECLIHQGPSGSGQDILTVAAPLDIMGGSNNPNPTLQGASGITDSDSIITVPIYDGSPLTPGLGDIPYVTIVGFMQVFVNQVDKGAQGTVHATILNVAGCGGGGGGAAPPPDPGTTPPPGGGVIVGPGGSLFPVRLVRTPTTSP